MAESTLKTLDDVMFVQGETPVNQENWQKYFGGVLPNGIYEGFAPDANQDYNRTKTVDGITAGVAVYNGLVYRMTSRFAVDSEVPESVGYRLLSLRIYPDTGVAKLVETRGNGPVSSDETILNGIIEMTQNPVFYGRDYDQNSYVDYRLCYQGHKNSQYKGGVDLRQPAFMRNGQFPTGWRTYWNGYQSAYDRIILSGNEVRNVVYPTTSWALSVWFDPVNPPDNARLVTNAHYVDFHEYPAILDVKRTSSPEQVDGTKDEFRNVIDCFGTNWDRQTITNPIQTYNPSVVWEYHDATPETPFVVQYRGKNGYNQNMFLIQMPTNGSSTEWGLVEGTLSNQTDLQDALDAKADATTVYTKTESDTRMYSKAETDALLDAKADVADVYTKTETGEIYYTKQESDALLDEKADSADVYDKTETYTKVEADTLLDAKANVSDVYAKTETYTKAEVEERMYTKTEADALLAAKANSADVYAKDKTYSKSEMDLALAGKANAMAVYTSSQTDTLLSRKEDKSALGSLAYKNYISAFDINGIIPVANGGTGSNVTPKIKANLESSLAGSSLNDGGTIGVQGVLPINKGGTGVSLSSIPQGIVSLASENKAELFADYPYLGVTGILPVTHGGTGYNNLKDIARDIYNVNGASVKYYVSTQGDNSNSGTEQVTALRTIREAINRIGYRVQGIIELIGNNQTFYEDNLHFDQASRYILIPNGNKITPDYIDVNRSTLIISGSVRISSGLDVTSGAKFIYDLIENNTITFDNRIYVSHSACFLGNVISNSSDNAFYVDGGLVTYASLTGSFSNIGVAKRGGIISTGDGHILS